MSAGIAAALRGLGHSVTVLAPSTRAADLLAGRRALVRGEPAEVIAVGPAVPISRRSQLGVPVGVQANLAAGLAQGELRRRPRVRAGPALALVPRASRHGRPRRRDVRVREPSRLSAGPLAAREAARRASMRSSLSRTMCARPPKSASRATTASSRRASTPTCSRPRRKQKTIVVELRPNERVVARGIVRTLRELPGWDVVLLRTRPLIGRPAIPRDLADRVHVRTARDAPRRAAVLNTAAIFVPGSTGCGA